MATETWSAHQKVNKVIPFSDSIISQNGIKIYGHKMIIFLFVKNFLVLDFFLFKSFFEYFS